MLSVNNEINLSKIVAKWVIKDFKSVYTKANLKSKLASPPILMTNSQRCCLVLYPKGTDEASKEYLSLFAQAYDFCSFEAKFTFYILDCTNTQRCRINLEKESFDYSSGALGCPGFLKYSRIESESNLLWNGDLIIGLEIETDLEMSHGAFSNDFVRSLDGSFLAEKLDKYEELLGNSKFSDVKFMIEGREICGHKNIIASQSSVFAAMFEHKMKENDDNFVHITDISYKVMYELLRFIYSGKVKDMKNVAVDLLIASEKYLVDDLKYLCENYLAQRFNFKNIVQYLNLAELHHAHLLKERGISYITNKADTITDSPHFDVRQLDSNVMKEVFHCMAKSKKRKTNEVKAS